MQFKDLGSLFDSFGELNFKHASKASSFADLDGIDKNTIKGLFKIDSNDISDFTMAQIQAKASTMGLTESLTDELMAMSKDADFTAKAKVGKVTWGEALKEGSTNADQIGKALMKSSDVSDKAKKKLSEVYDKFGSGSQVYQKQLENIINGANGLDDISGKFTTLGADVQKSTGMFESAGNIIKGFFASIKGYIPILAVAGTAFAAFKLWDYSQTGYTRAKEKAEASASTYSKDKSNLQSLQQELDTTKSKIEELNATKEQNGGLSLTDEAELSRLEQENAQLERKVAIQKQLTEISAQAASSDAQKAANTAQTYWDHLKEKNGGGFFGTLKSIPEYFATKREEKDGKVYLTNVAENTVDPSESHTELESLSVDGNCYFDTEILSDQNTNTEAKLYIKSGTTYICGARDDKYKYGYSTTDNFYVVRGSVSSAVKNTAFWEDTWTIKQNGATATFGNNSVTLDNAGNFTLTSPYYIGCMSKNGEAAGVGLKGKIYYAKIYSGSNLVADMIPVKKSDGTLCLYDKVRKKYIYKTGNGTLTE